MKTHISGKYNHVGVLKLHIPWRRRQQSS